MGVRTRFLFMVGVAGGAACSTPSQSPNPRSPEAETESGTATTDWVETTGGEGEVGPSTSGEESGVPSTGGSEEAGSGGPGCTDATAANYDASADTDDGSCIFPNECDAWTTVDFDAEMENFGNDATRTLRNVAGADVTCTVIEFGRAHDTYSFDDCADTLAGFCHRLNDTNRNLLFNGNSATFVFSEPIAGFVDINASSNVYFRDFAMIHDPRPFTQGAIVGIAPVGKQEWIDVEIDTSASFRPFDDLAYDADGDGASDLLGLASGTWGNVFEDSGEMLTGVLRHSYQIGAEAQAVASTATTQTWRITPVWLGDFPAFASAFDSATTPLHWVSVAKGGAACFRVRFTPPDSRVVYDNLSMSTCAIQAFGMFHNEGGIDLLNSTIERPPQGLISTNGGVVLDHHHRSPLRMIDNEFAGIADDGVNINTTEKPVVRDTLGAPQIDCAGRTILLNGDVSSGEVRADDVLQLTANEANANAGHQYRGSLLARGAVVSATVLEGEARPPAIPAEVTTVLEVVMEEPFWANLCVGPTFALPSTFAAYSMFNEADAAPSSEILRNRFELRGTGVHNIGVDATIRGNAFVRGITGVSVGVQHRFENDNWAGRDEVGPGPYPHGLVIDGNTFDGAGFGAPYAPPSSPTKPNNVQLFLPACHVQTHDLGVCDVPISVEITNNEFSRGHTSSVQVYGGAAVVDGNTFEAAPGQGAYFPVNLTNAALTYRNNTEDGVSSSSCQYDVSAYTPSSAGGAPIETMCSW